MRPVVTRRSSVLAITYYDAARGRGAVLELVKDVVGDVLPPYRLGS